MTQKESVSSQRHDNSNSTITMKAYILTLLALSSIASSTPAIAQTTQKLTASKANEYGLIYSLPRTVLDVTIEAECTVRRPGEFYKYAKKYLKDDSGIATASEVWTLKSIIVVPRGVADTDERYIMQFKSGSSPFLMLNEENVPVALNTEQIPQAVNIDLPTAIAASPTPLETPAAKQAITEEMRQSQSIAKRAELAAAQISALRQSRNDYITGQADQMPPDGKALQIIMDNITAQEAALTAMFLGTTQTSTAVATYTYTPDEPRTNDILARLSPSKGIVDQHDLSGEPIYITIDVTSKGALPVNEKGEEKKFPKGGVAYRIPGTALVKIDYCGNRLYAKSIDMAQFGLVFGLDPALFTDKKAPAYLLLDPVTGAIRELGSSAGN